MAQGEIGSERQSWGQLAVRPDSFRRGRETMDNSNGIQINIYEGEKGEEDERGGAGATRINGLS